MSTQKSTYILLVIVLLTACTPQAQISNIQATNTPTQKPSLTPTATFTPTPTATFTLTPTTTPTPTPLPMAGPITEGVEMRLGKGWIVAKAFSPSGKFLSVATNIGVYLYATEKMELISFLPGKAFIETIAFFDDKTLMVAYSDATTAVWDIENSPTLVNTLEHNDPAVLLTTDNDNNIFIVERGFIDRPVNVLVWDRINPAIVNSLMTAYLGGATYSKEKNLLVLQTLSGKIILVDTQKMRATATICQNYCSGIRLSPNGELLAMGTGQGDKRKIVIFDTTTQKELYNIPAKGILRVAFSLENKLQLFVSDELTTPESWDADTIELVRVKVPAGASGIAFSSNGLLLAFKSQDGDLVLKDLENENANLIVKGFTPISQAIFQNKYIASTTSTYSWDSFWGDRDAIILRDKLTGEIVRTFSPVEKSPDNTFEILSYIFSPDGKKIASEWRKVRNNNRSAAKNVLIFFNVDTGEQLKSMKGFTPLVFSPDGSLLAVASAGNRLSLIDVLSGETLPVALGLAPTDYFEKNPYEKSVIFSPDGSMLAILSNKIILRDTLTGKQLKIFESGLDEMLEFIGFGPDASGIIGEFSPDGQILASTSLLATSEERFFPKSKGIVILWDVESGEKLFTLEGHTKSITSIAYSPDNTLLATGAEDNTIIIWDTQSGDLIKILEGHTGIVTSLSFSSEGNLLYSNASDGTVIVWSMEQFLP